MEKEIELSRRFRWIIVVDVGRVDDELNEGVHIALRKVYDM